MAHLVVDSSFIIAVLVEEEHSPWASELILRLDGETLLAPSLLVWEVASVLQKKVRQKRISLDERTFIIDRFATFSVELQPPFPPEALPALLILCERHGLTAYDGAYLSMALETGAAITSLDVELVQAARVEGITVHSPF